MLDKETKDRINTARDILVGKVPDPKSQVEQITIALIYKFMDDMDLEAEELGGARSFFTGEYEKYTWHKLFAPSTGGEQRLQLYSEALLKLSQNPKLPALFRDIFKNAYLPYRDPETLSSFLKEINKFSYDHSERLGDAFEFLLSVLGSQGDAGQFRTPRHLIDFMVAITDPRKDETILDPACGTAGFLISSYKHILRHNTARGKSTLTPDERRRLAENFRGYDISPDMVRLSLVNLYLHGFAEPCIHEYDTLTSEDRWNEYYDIVLANPPFMSPKGGIRPHKRFRIASNRSEVLFVDYIAEHLSTQGRAAVIVPEGIIFQSGTAYKELRKMLVDGGFLVGVVSLPAGVFNPYSGVKTSILWLDKSLAKKTDKLLFVKIGNDGYDLGAQRRELKSSDLPDALRAIEAYKQSVQSGAAFDAEGWGNVTVVEKARVAENGEYGLSGERYREAGISQTSFPLVELGDERLFYIESGGTPSSTDDECWNGEVKWITLVDLPAQNLITEIYDSERKITEKGLKTSSAKLIPQNSVIVSSRATIGRIGINKTELATNQGFKNVIIKDFEKVHPKFVALMLTQLVGRMEQLASGGTFKEISKTNFKTLQIPLPPLSVQQEIVSEVEGYQRVIEGARQVVESYRPRVEVDEAWEWVELGEVCENLDSKRIPITKSDRKSGPYPYYGASGIVDYVESYLFDEELLLISEDGANLLARVTPIAFSVSGKIWVNNHAHVLRFKERETQKFVEFYLNTIPIDRYVTGAAQPKLNQQALNSIKIPLPDLPTQGRIVSELERERVWVEGCRELVRGYEERIRRRVGRVWGE